MRLGQGLGHFGDDDGEGDRGEAGEGRAGPTAGNAESSVRVPEGALRGPTHPPYLRDCPIITNYIRTRCLVVDIAREAEHDEEPGAAVPANSGSEQVSAAVYPPLWVGRPGMENQLQRD